jgi:hypothetical protein
MAVQNRRPRAAATMASVGDSAVSTSLEVEPSMGNHARPRQFQTPREDGGKLVAPPVSDCPELIIRNRRRLEACDYDVHGETLSELARAARKQLLDEALAYTRSYRDLDISRARGGHGVMPSLVLAGHQPELFHPGVWLKNFMLDRVARDHGAVAINLQVDSDTMKASSLRVPVGTVARPMVEAVLFDQPVIATPFEERRIVDRRLFETFAERAAQRIETFVPSPLVREFWPEVVRRSRDTNRLGECLAQARHIWEQRWGATTLEIPQSRVCSLPAFHRFAAHLLAHLPRLWDIYNAALFDYRHVNRVRSHAHPVPELAAEGEWLEAPFWIWRAEDPVRRRLFVGSRRDQIVLADRTGWEQSLDLSADAAPDRATEQLQDLARGGVRLRTRALITTMLARVLLGDLFLHGIGGAKYDQMTDVLVERFFGLKPPDYMVVSGTLRLPIEHHRGAAAELCRSRQSMRELAFHPERFVDVAAEKPRCERCSGPSQHGETAEPHRSIDAKRQWIATAKTPANAPARHQAIRAANNALQPWVSERREKLRETIERLEEQARAGAILASREYSFCLYPEERLRDFLAAP